MSQTNTNAITTREKADWTKEALVAEAAAVAEVRKQSGKQYNP